jgi:hypothetical protein
MVIDWQLAPYVQCSTVQLDCFPRHRSCTRSRLEGGGGLETSGTAAGFGGGVRSRERLVALNGAKAPDGAAANANGDVTPR